MRARSGRPTRNFVSGSATEHGRARIPAIPSETVILMMRARRLVNPYVPLVLDQHVMTKTDMCGSSSPTFPCFFSKVIPTRDLDETRPRCGSMKAESFDPRPTLEARIASRSARLGPKEFGILRQARSWRTATRLICGVIRLGRAAGKVSTLAMRRQRLTRPSTTQKEASCSSK